MPFWGTVIVMVVLIYMIYSIVKGFLLTQKCKNILKRRRMLMGFKEENHKNKDSESGDSGGL